MKISNPAPALVFQEFNILYRKCLQDFYAKKYDNTVLTHKLNEILNIYSAQLPKGEKFYTQKIHEIRKDIEKFEGESAAENKAIMRDRDDIIVSINMLVDGFDKFTPTVPPQIKSMDEILENKISQIQSKGESIKDDIGEKYGDVGMEKLRNGAVNEIDAIVRTRVAEIQKLKTAKPITAAMKEFTDFIKEAKNCNNPDKYNSLIEKYNTFRKNLEANKENLNPESISNLLGNADQQMRLVRKAIIQEQKAQRPKREEANIVIAQFDSFAKKIVTQDDGKIGDALLIDKYRAVQIELKRIFGEDSASDSAKQPYLKAAAKIIETASKAVEGQLGKRSSEANKKKISSWCFGIFGGKRNPDPNPAKIDQSLGASR